MKQDVKTAIKKKRWNEEGAQMHTTWTSNQQRNATTSTRSPQTSTSTKT